MRAGDLEQKLDAFLEANTEQLTQIGLPRSLWAVLWAKIEASRFGSIDSQFALALDTFSDRASSDPVPIIVSASKLNPHNSLLVYPHDWTFTSRDQAKNHLESSEELKARLVDLIKSADVIDPMPSLNQSNGSYKVCIIFLLFY